MAAIASAASSIYFFHMTEGFDCPA